MKKMICLLFFSCLVLAGCAQFRPIQEAEGVPRAKLRVIGGDGFVRGYSKGQEEATIIGGMVGSDGFRNRSLGMPNPERIGGQPFAEFYVEAGKPFTLFFITGPDSFYQCSVKGNFIPEEGKSYEALAQLRADKKACLMGVSIFSGEGQWRPVPINRQ